MPQLAVVAPPFFDTAGKLSAREVLKSRARPLPAEYTGIALHQQSANRRQPIRCPAKTVGQSPSGEAAGGKEGREGAKDVSRKTRGFGSVAKGTGDKGFGNKAPRGKKAAPSNDEQISSILRRVEAEEVASGKAPRGGSSLDIDANVAGLGKVDFVRVENWEGGDVTGGPEQIENLKLKSFSQAFSAEDDADPFYDQLVKRIQLLDSRGELAVVQTKPLPPFDRWQFGADRYRRYLVDQYAIHHSLEEALPANNELPPGMSTSAAQDGAGGDSPLVPTGTSSTGLNVELPGGGPWEALASFGPSLGLHRSAAVLADINAMSSAMDQSGGEVRAQKSPLPPTPQTASYAQVISTYQPAVLSIFSSWGGRPGRRKDQRRNSVYWAHVFSVQVAHLTSGMKIGAKAVGCLGGKGGVLQRAGAVRFYRDYPEVAKNPLAVFVGAVNRAGEILGRAEERELVMEELATAMQRTSLLLTEIAVEDTVRNK